MNMIRKASDSSLFYKLGSWLNTESLHENAWQAWS